jgi:hypothetical protein
MVGRKRHRKPAGDGRYAEKRPGCCPLHDLLFTPCQHKGAEVRQPIEHSQLPEGNKNYVPALLLEPKDELHKGIRKLDLTVDAQLGPKVDGENNSVDVLCPPAKVIVD